METMEIKNGVIGLGATNEDWIMGASDTLPELPKQDTVRYYYNQGNSNDCTIYSPIGALSNLWNYKFTAKEIADVNELSYSRGRTRGEGWYVLKGVKCACDWWNEHFPNKKVAYYRIDMIDTDTIMDVISKNYNICTGYQGNYNYNYDYIVDCMLDGNSFGKATYGHAVSVIDNEGQKSIQDNYEPRLNSKKQNTNVYGVKPEFKKLVENNVFYPNGYVIIKCEDERLKELKRLNQFRQDVEQAIELNSKMWLESTEGYEPTDPRGFRYKLHQQNEYLRGKLKDIQTEMNKFS